MEREVWARAGMVLSVLALAALIFVTPDLLGRPSPELASLPLLIIGLSKNESTLIVNVGAAVQAYRYELIRVGINGTDPGVNATYEENDTYEWHTRVPADVMFTVHTYLVDQEDNYFEYNVTARLETDAANRTVMIFTFPYERDMTPEIRRYPPEDFRWLIPRRGTL